MDKATPTPSPASADTRDIVLRLRDTPNWLYESYASWKDSVCKYSRAPFEAADEIERLRAEVERLAAQAAPTEPPQEFESAQGRALASAWAEGWAQCRDAEYVGEEAESEAFNQSATLAQCLHADQTRFQGGLSNDELRRAWSAKLPNVIPTDEQLTAFALGIEAAAQPSQAPVVLAVQPEYCTACDMTSNDKQRCEDCPRRASSGATTQAVRMLTREELNDVALSEKVGWGPGEYIEAVQRKFAEVNGLRIPADGVIGGAT